MTLPDPIAALFTILGTERYSADRVAWKGNGGEDAHPIAEGSFNEGSH